jgi:hypothetical protein
MLDNWRQKLCEDIPEQSDLKRRFTIIGVIVVSSIVAMFSSSSSTAAATKNDDAKSQVVPS